MLVTEPFPTILDETSNCLTAVAENALVAVIFAVKTDCNPPVAAKVLVPIMFADLYSVVVMLAFRALDPTIAEALFKVVLTWALRKPSPTIKVPELSIIGLTYSSDIPIIFAAGLCNDNGNFAAFTANGLAYNSSGLRMIL